MTLSGRKLVSIFLLGCLSWLVPLSAAASVRNIIEFRIPAGRQAAVGEFQTGKSPTYQVGTFLVDGKVVGQWDITQASEAQRVFRVEVQAQPGQDISASVNLTRTNYGPMSVFFKSKDVDTVWTVEWFVDSIHMAGSKPLGTVPAKPAPASPPPQSPASPSPGATAPPAPPASGPHSTVPAPGGKVDGIDSLGPLRAVNFNLGRQWHVQEHSSGGHIWQGLWVRRGNSKIFDATWRLDGTGNPVSDVLEVRGMRDNVVEIYRRGNHGTYYGPLSRDKKSIEQGSASWYGSEWWEARIDNSSPAAPPPQPQGVGHSAGSHEASTNVVCVRGSEVWVGNWVRGCVTFGAQVFQRVTFRNPGTSPTTAPVRVPGGVMVYFDRYGYWVPAPVSP